MKLGTAIGGHQRKCTVQELSVLSKNGYFPFNVCNNMFVQGISLKVKVFKGIQ